MSNINVTGNHLASFSELRIQSHIHRSNEAEIESCLQALRCPDPQLVKNRLREDKGRLVEEAIGWILESREFIAWRDDDHVSLLWIKGGAGKGKTMISVCLIQELSQSKEESEVVTYFFCQNNNIELNTIASILKGLIRRLVDQQHELKSSLLERWDTDNECFREDMTSWQVLWYVFLEILEKCQCTKVYVLIDALDECQGQDMADLLKRLVRSGLQWPSKVKWLLTSRPLDSAEQELLAGSDQVPLSLELNSGALAQVVQIYIERKVVDLDRRHHYGPALCRKLQDQLQLKAERTFLWVSLVCKRLEDLPREQALSAIQNSPAGLQHFYDRMIAEINKGNPSDIKLSLRLLKVILLAFRPLNVLEIGGITGISENDMPVQRLIDRCGSFIKLNGTFIEVIHQSVRDYLTKPSAQALLDSYEEFGYGAMALNCLAHATKQLRPNLVGLETPGSVFTPEGEEWNNLAHVKYPVLLSLNYAGPLWAKHLESAGPSRLAEDAVKDGGMVDNFLRSKLLEWLESLTLLLQLPYALDTLKAVQAIIKASKAQFEGAGSAIIFSPERSLIRESHFDQLPKWLKRLPRIQKDWDPLLQTIFANDRPIFGTSFTSDGNTLMSVGASPNDIKCWNSTTGDELFVEKGSETYGEGHGDAIFSLDGRWVACKGNDNTILTCDIGKRQVRKLLLDSEYGISTIAISPDGSLLASIGAEKTIKIWSLMSGGLQSTIDVAELNTHKIQFSPDGKQIGYLTSLDTFNLWNLALGTLQMELIDNIWDIFHISTFALSPDGKQIATYRLYTHILLWDWTSKGLQQQIQWNDKGATEMFTFSLDSKYIASITMDSIIKLWNCATGELHTTCVSHASRITNLSFSGDTQRVASTSEDGMIKIWDYALGTESRVSDIQQSAQPIIGLAFSLDGNWIASGSRVQSLTLWDTRTKDTRPEWSQNVESRGSVEGLQAIAFSNDSERIGTGGLRGFLGIWDRAKGKLILEIMNARMGIKSIRAVAFSNHGKWLASGSDDGKIKLWDSRTGVLLKSLIGNNGDTCALAFSPDNKRLASGCQHRSLRLWDMQKVMRPTRMFGKRIGSRIDHIGSSYVATDDTEYPVWWMHFSTDGTHLATSVGVIETESILQNSERYTVKDLGILNVKGSWVLCGNMPIFRFSTDYLPCTRVWAARGDQIAIAYQNGQMLRFEIDRRQFLEERGLITPDNPDVKFYGDS
ncbi:uncharacterized protein KY384_001776 [Bacidia gigantensis]|uniref:uncharacterized protein n=1 Tax=Bacidia gigantensis TaxID=2732470 RepID=UPI001D056747|nr:uncharacterized protein KY384_001776 [Bacidia gigantensis]KAG8532994.1 hypothetical protein KY384_001776 [Bacidia gigantensis]